MLIFRALGPMLSLIIAGLIIAIAADVELSDMLIHIARQFSVLRTIF